MHDTKVGIIDSTLTKVGMQKNRSIASSYLYSLHELNSCFNYKV